MPCPACDRIALIRQGQHPAFIAELRESFAVLHDHQPLQPWVILLLKDHHEHYGELPRTRQLRLTEDIADTAAAIKRATSCPRINYECLGNIMNHIHWHIIPRFTPPTDPDPKKPIWVLGDSWLNSGSTPELQTRLIMSLHAAGLTTI